VSARRPPSLSEQGRRLSDLRRRIAAIHDAAEAHARTDPKHAAAWHAQAQAEAAPLIAEGAALRDAIVARARRRAKLAWAVVYAGCALIVILLTAWRLL
jgi:ferric-dicitrate binding protein FerR (iron transport regulator)